MQLLSLDGENIMLTQFLAPTVLSTPMSGSEQIRNLYNAAQEGNIDKVRELLADPEVAQQATMVLDIQYPEMVPPQPCPIHFAIMDVAINAGHLEIVRELLTVPGIATLSDRDIIQIAHSAVRSPNVEILNLLLTVPAVSTEIKNNDGIHPYHGKLWYAIVNGRLENAVRLMELPEIVNNLNVLEALKDTIEILNALHPSDGKRDPVPEAHELTLIRMLTQKAEDQGIDIFSNLSDEQKVILSRYSAAKNTSLFDMLLSVINEPTVVDLTTPLHTTDTIKDLYNAAQEGNDQRVKQLLANREVAEQATMTIEVEFSQMNPPVSAQIPFAIMNAAINCGRLNVVKQLLNLPGMATLTERDILQIAYSAMISPNVDVLKHLLTVPAVSDQIALNNSILPYHSSLWYAIVNGRLENANLLMTIPAIANEPNMIDVLKDTIRVLNYLHTSGVSNRLVPERYEIEFIAKILNAATRQGLDVESHLSVEEKTTLDYYLPSQPKEIFYRGIGFNGSEANVAQPGSSSGSSVESRAESSSKRPRLN